MTKIKYTKALEDHLFEKVEKGEMSAKEAARVIVDAEKTLKSIERSKRKFSFSLSLN